MGMTAAGGVNHLKPQMYTALAFAALRAVGGSDELPVQLNTDVLMVARRLYHGTVSSSTRN